MTARLHAEIRDLQLRLRAVKARLKETRRWLDIAYRERVDLATELEQLRHAGGWMVARADGGGCLFCGKEITRGQAFQLVPGEGKEIQHVHCPDWEGPSMTDPGVTPA